ncbi:MazG nucleotide pyrophosphohydrolase domain-containing protein [Aliivibrio wodanis]|uniref:MazG nucleotide pyrophosphohydrolase domain-containing protein n=1 Tax=Aliivibrio wodanis TaxID=80852 RepID=UPI00406CD327
MQNKIGFYLEELQKISKVKAQRDLKGTWYKNSFTYLDAFIDEVEEVKYEIKADRQCFLEDELGDLLWNYVCLLEHLELEGKVAKDQIFRRALKKYSERVSARNIQDNWDDVKERQKQELINEHQLNINK